MWARIDTGTVAEITDQDPSGRFHPAIPWVKCGDDTQPGWHYDGEQFLPPIPKPLSDLAARKRAEIDAALATSLAVGLPYTMPGGSDDVIQTRPEDESNLLGLAIEARDLRDAGETGAVQELRAQSNTIYAMTPEQMIAATDAAKAFKKQQLARSWSRKDDIDAALGADDREGIEAVSW